MALNGRFRPRLHLSTLLVLTLLAGGFLALNVAPPVLYGAYISNADELAQKDARPDIVEVKGYLRWRGWPLAKTWHCTTQESFIHTQASGVDDELYNPAKMLERDFGSLTCDPLALWTYDSWWVIPANVLLCGAALALLGWFMESRIARRDALKQSRRSGAGDATPAAGASPHATVGSAELKTDGRV